MAVYSNNEKARSGSVGKSEWVEIETRRLWVLDPRQLNTAWTLPHKTRHFVWISPAPSPITHSVDLALWLFAGIYTEILLSCFCFNSRWYLFQHRLTVANGYTIFAAFGAKQEISNIRRHSNSSCRGCSWFFSEVTQIRPPKRQLLISFLAL